MSKRTDATYNRNASIFCPHARREGFVKGHAEYGDLITFTIDDNGPIMTGRVLGRVDATGGETLEKVVGFIQVLTLSHDMCDIFEHWVNPENVKTVREFTGRLAAWFAQPRLPYDAETLIRLQEYGTLSEHYIEGAQKRVEAWEAEKKR